MLNPENKKEAIMHGSSTDDQFFQCQLSAMNTEISCIATYAIFCKILNPALLTTFFFFFFLAYVSNIAVQSPCSFPSTGIGMM